MKQILFFLFFFFGLLEISFGQLQSSIGDSSAYLKRIAPSKNATNRNIKIIGNVRLDTVSFPTGGALKDSADAWKVQNIKQSDSLTVHLARFVKAEDSLQAHLERLRLKDSIDVVRRDSIAVHKTSIDSARTGTSSDWQVTTAKIAAGAVTSSKLDDSLSVSADLTVGTTDTTGLRNWVSNTTTAESRKTLDIRTGLVIRPDATYKGANLNLLNGYGGNSQLNFWQLNSAGVYRPKFLIGTDLIDKSAVDSTKPRFVLLGIYRKDLSQGVHDYICVYGDTLRRDASSLFHLGQTVFGGPHPINGIFNFVSPSASISTAPSSISIMNVHRTATDSTNNWQEYTVGSSQLPQFRHTYNHTLFFNRASGAWAPYSGDGWTLVGDALGTGAINSPQIQAGFFQANISTNGGSTFNTFTVVPTLTSTTQPFSATSYQLNQGTIITSDTNGTFRQLMAQEGITDSGGIIINPDRSGANGHLLLNQNAAEVSWRGLANNWWRGTNSSIITGGLDFDYYNGTTWADRVTLEPDGDVKLSIAGKGIILTNAAGTVTRRVRLNDAGDGLIFEAP